MPREKCGHCGGTGYVEAYEPCKVCQDDGYVCGDCGAGCDHCTCGAGGKPQKLCPECGSSQVVGGG